MLFYVIANVFWVQSYKIIFIYANFFVILLKKYQNKVHLSVVVSLCQMAVDNLHNLYEDRRIRENCLVCIRALSTVKKYLNYLLQ